jgi:4,5-dihydroxyphthalate decarboxylase
VSVADPLELTLAINDYDHVRDLASGRVAVEGVDLRCLILSVEEIFFRFTAYREWDVSELSFAKYASLVASGDRSLTAIPVFPSRVFRHSAFYVRDDGSVGDPTQLAGRRVGVPEWVMTAGIWARGLLQHEYGVELRSVDWYQGGLNEPGREELVAPTLPEGVSLTTVADRTLEEMLLAGDIDAILAPRPPRGIADPEKGIVRLVRDYRRAEADYFRASGVFPIMHVVALRSELHERHPWVAMNLMTGFEEAKRRSLDRFDDASASRFPLPWSWDAAARSRELLGADPWPYGLEPNRTTLTAFLRYAFEQGVCARELEPEELFPETVARVHRV